LYEVTEKRDIHTNVKMFKVRAPAVSHKASPGQFVIIRTDEKGERIPITIAGAEPEEETVTIYFAEVGASTEDLGSLNVGDRILNFSGPLGNVIPIKGYGEVLCVAGGVFQGVNLYLAEALHGEGNVVTSVQVARSIDHLFLVDETRETCDESHTIVDGEDGDRLRDLITRLLDEKKMSRVFTFGPVPLQRMVAELASARGVPSSVNLYPIMVDGTGMCGACRVTVGGATRFACIDGPEFDGGKVDFDELTSRLRYYTPQEKIAMVLKERGVI
jgi:ferredoxin--NADP+ reductase